MMQGYRILLSVKLVLKAFTSTYEDNRKNPEGQESHNGGHLSTIPNVKELPPFGTISTNFALTIIYIN